jgi:hypothetical protein
MSNDLDPQPLVPDDQKSSTVPNPSGLDRRLKERKPLSVRARLALQGKPPLEIRTFDIDAGGVGIISEINLPIHTLCNVFFKLPQPDGTLFNVAAAGTVTYCTFSRTRMGFTSGLAFKEVPELLLCAINNYMKG